MSLPLVLESKLPLSQQLLLKAILSETDAAIDAWALWKQTINLDHLEDGSFRLLPSLYQRLQNQGIHDPLVGRLRNVYQHTWYKNNILLNTLSPLWTALDGAGVPYCAVDDLAVVLTAYPDPGLRPLTGVDIYISPAGFHVALQQLLLLGWQSAPNTRLPAQTVQYTHTTGCSLRLHRIMDPGSPWAKVGRDWPLEDVSQPQSSPPLLAAPWLVIRACLQLAPWVLHPSPVAVLDAHRLIALWNSDDWETLVRLAQACQCTRPVLDVLTLLSTRFQIAVPAAASQGLMQATSSQEQRFYKFSRRCAPAASILVKWRVFNRLNGKAPLWRNCVCFPLHLAGIRNCNVPQDNRVS